MTTDDTGSPATALLAERAATLGLDLSSIPSLADAYERSNGIIGDSRRLLRDAASDAETKADIVGFGSLARREFTSESDFDYLVVTYGLDKQPGTARRMLQHADSLRKNLIPGREISAPGATGVFGRVSSATDMVERIGLEEDTNHSHTRRILLLEESVSLFRPDLHSQLLGSVIDRYLFGRVMGTDGVPRFLLNDVVRYWRTIAVDYQAKTFGRGLYSLRYLKLLISRKLAFASSLVPLAECSQLESERVGTHLLEAFQEPMMPRLMRLGQNLSRTESVDSLRACLTIADAFCHRLSSSDWRETVARECQEEDPTGAPEFGQVRQWGKDLQQHLVQVFLDPSVRDFTIKYLIF